MDFREWIAAALVDADDRPVARYGPRGGHKHVARPFDPAQIESAHFHGEWHNDSTAGVSLVVHLVDGDWLLIDSDPADNEYGTDDTFDLPLNET